MIGTTIAVSLAWLVWVVALGAYFACSAIVEERFIGRPLPGLLSAVQALDQDADPVHFLSFHCIARSGASPPCRVPKRGVGR